MPQISREEFERLPLRVHAFLAGVPLHDAWAVDLPRPRGGITLAEFIRHAGNLFQRPEPAVRTLLSIRLFIGGLFGWDRETTGSFSESFAQRLTDEDRTRSLVPGGDAGRTLSHRVPLCERATGRGRQSYSARWSAQRARRGCRRLPLLLGRLRPRGRPLHPTLHGRDRSVPKTDRLPGAAPWCLRTVERNVRSRYDYVVVLGGSSGAALVARLSEHSALKVLLEAGRFWRSHLPWTGRTDADRAHADSISSAK